jgi:hypothetical protein
MRDKEKQKQYNKQYRLEHQEHIKQYRLEHAEYAKQHSKQWYLEHLEHRKQYEKQYYLDHPEYKKQWAKDHPEIVRESHRKSKSERRDLGFIPWNFYKKGDEFHHMDKVGNGVYMDKKIHHSIYHSVLKDINMDIINSLAFNYLGDR